MARVLLLTLVYPPDNVSTAHIVGDLAADLHAGEHDVTVLTTSPHYNRDAEAEARQPLQPWWSRLVQRSTHRGVPVYHTWMPAKSASVPARLAAWCLFHALSLIVGVVALRRVDVIIAPSPPLTTGVAAWLLGLRHRAPFIYNVQEIYPDIAINLGVLRNRTAIALLLRLERFVYARAAAITVIAERMRQRLLDKGVPPERVSVIPNFVDLDATIDVPPPNGFTREFGIDGRFIVTYAGNLGPAQGLDALVTAAERLRDRPEVIILLLGGGTLGPTLTASIAERGLTNILVLPFQPITRMPEIYGASDLSVVSQAAATGSDAVPSKVYRIMASRRAVLAITDPASDLAKLVRDAACGFVVPASDPAAIAAAVRQAIDTPGLTDTMGAQGRAHVERYYRRTTVTAQYAGLVTRLATDSQ